MNLYDKDQVKKFSDLLEKNYPNVWNFIVKNESGNGLYSYEEEQEFYSIVYDTYGSMEALKTTALFFGVRSFASYKIGLNKYNEEF